MVRSRFPEAFDPTQASVYVVEDEAGMRVVIGTLLRSVGLLVEEFDSATRCLSSLASSPPNCLVADVRLPDMSGVVLLDQLRAKGHAPPVILISGHADVMLAVQAMRSGAFDFLQKPFHNQALLDSVQHALRLDHANRLRWQQENDARALVARLSHREQEVLSLLVKGCGNKQVAIRLGLSIKTVERHRAQIFEKLERDHLGDIIVIAHAAGIDCTTDSLKGE